MEAQPLETLDQERWVFTQVRYSLALVNQKDYSKTLWKDDVFSFSKRDIDRGWHTFVDTINQFSNNDSALSCMYQILKKPHFQRSKEELAKMTAVIQEVPWFKEREMTESTLLELVNVMTL